MKIFEGIDIYMWSNPTVVAGIFGFGGAILGAVIAGVNSWISERSKKKEIDKEFKIEKLEEIHRLVKSISNRLMTYTKGVDYDKDQLEMNKYYKEFLEDQGRLQMLIYSYFPSLKKELKDFLASSTTLHKFKRVNIRNLDFVSREIKFIEDAKKRVKFLEKNMDELSDVEKENLKLLKEQLEKSQILKGVISETKGLVNSEEEKALRMGGFHSIDEVTPFLIESERKLSKAIYSLANQIAS